MPLQRAQQPEEPSTAPEAPEPELADIPDVPDVEESLEGSAPDGVIVPAISGSIADMKALRDRCLEVGIPAAVGCPPGAGKSCGPRTHLLVHEDDVPRLAALLGDDWRSQLAREGLAPVAVTADEEAEHLPCPACGTAAPLVEGACSDCGLQLE
jgi:hypothetical protein